MDALDVKKEEVPYIEKYNYLWWEGRGWGVEHR